MAPIHTTVLQKIDNDSKRTRPAGTGERGSAPPGPNSGRKWVHRSDGSGAGGAGCVPEGVQGEGGVLRDSSVLAASAVGETFYSVFSPIFCILHSSPSLRTLCSCSTIRCSHVRCPLLGLNSLLFDCHFLFADSPIQSSLRTILTLTLFSSLISFLRQCGGLECSSDRQCCGGCGENSGDRHTRKQLRLIASHFVMCNRVQNSAMRCSAVQETAQCEFCRSDKCSCSSLLSDLSTNFNHSTIQLTARDLLNTRHGMRTCRKPD